MLLTGVISDTADIRLGGSSPDIMNSGNGWFFVAKYNSSAVKQWAFALKHYSTGPQYGNYPDKIRCDANNNVYIAGILRDTVDFDPGPAIKKVYAFQKFWSDAFVAKYTSTGTLIYAAALGGADDDYLNGFDVGKNNTLYFNFQAFSASFDVDFTSGVQTYTKAASFDHVILHSDSNGAPLKVFDVSTPYTDYFFTDIDEFDGSLHLVGQTGNAADYDPSPTASFTPASFGTFDMTVTRYKYYATTPTVSTVGLEKDNISTDTPIIFPNPTERFVKVERLPSPGLVNVFNNVGQKVLSAEISTDRTIDLGGLANGIYFLEVKSDEGNSVFKVVKKF